MKFSIESWSVQTHRLRFTQPEIGRINCTLKTTCTLDLPKRFSQKTAIFLRVLDETILVVSMKAVENKLVVVDGGSLLGP